jgi:hypothetical protein
LFATNGVNDGGIYYNGNDDKMEFYTADTSGVPQAVIDSSGRVGIGTTSPVCPLNVKGTDGDRIVYINGGTRGLRIGADSTSCKIEGVDGTDGTSAFQPLRLGGADIRFFNGNTEVSRIDSSGRLLVGTVSDSGGALLQVNGNRIRIATAKTPASATDTGVAGEICWDSGYIYVCTATNTWKRAALATW